MVVPHSISIAVWIGPILRNDRPAAELSDMLASQRLDKQYTVQSKYRLHAM
jgi:hypothetical protein